MKIAYIAPQPIPSKSANSIHVMKMMQALGRHGHEATVLFPKSDGFNKDDICAFYGVDRVFSMIAQNKWLFRLHTVTYPVQNILTIKNLKPDLVFSRNLLTAWLATQCGYKTIFEIHDSPESLNPLALKFFKNLSKKKNIKFVSISNALSRHLQQDFNLSPLQIILAPDAADPLVENSTDVPFEKKAGSFHVGYTGHLYKGRGLEIIGNMASAMPEIYFHIVGGTDSDIEYWRRIFQSQPNIIFHGHVSHAEVRKFLKNFDVLLSPYQKSVAVSGNAGETARWMSPLKIFEYMSTGKPMICSDLPVLREVLNDSNAYLCAADDVDSWIAALQDLQQNPRKGEELGQQAQQDFLSKYTWAKRAENIINAVIYDAG